MQTKPVDDFFARRKVRFSSRDRTTGQQHSRPVPTVERPDKKRAIEEDDGMEIEFPCVRMRFRQRPQDFRPLLDEQKDRRARQGDEEAEARRLQTANYVAEKPPGLLEPAPTTIHLGYLRVHDFLRVSERPTETTVLFVINRYYDNPPAKVWNFSAIYQAEVESASPGCILWVGCKRRSGS